MGGIRLLHSLRAQIAVMLIIQLALFSAIVGFTLYELSLRKHDYIILNLAGQLRVISQDIENQSLIYSEKHHSTPGDHSYDSQVYRTNLRLSMDQFDTIIYSFQQRNLSPELTGRSDPLYCSWDKRSLSQLDLTAASWMDFRDKLLAKLQQPSAASDSIDAAEYALQHQTELFEVSTNLSQAFREMMEDKLALISRLNMASIILMAVMALGLIALLLVKVFKPLKETVKGFKKISQGDFDHQLPVSVQNEIGDMISSFNHLSKRLSGLFKLTQRINMATTPQENFAFLSDEFEAFLQFEWVSMLCINAVSKMQLHYQYANGVMMLPEQNEFMVTEKEIVKAVLRQRPVIIPDIEKLDHSDEFIRAARNTNLRSMIILPLNLRNMEGAMMIFASVYPDAYNDDHIELMSNIALMLSRSFEKARDYEAIKVKRDSALGETRAKNAYISNISHEIRTPLAALSGYTELLMEKMRDNKDENYKRELESIRLGVEQLLKLTGNILDITKIDVNKMELFMEESSLANLLDVVATIAKPLMNKNKNQFDCLIPDKEISVNIDKTRFNQVILTLLSNAAKFTSKGTVSIHSEQINISGQDYINIYVEDTGVGMSEEQLASLFIDSSKPDASSPSKFQVAGLDLAVCQRLVNMMGGELFVKSQPGSGTCFTLQLPVQSNCKEMQKTGVI